MIYQTKDLEPVTAHERKLLRFIWRGFEPEDGWPSFASVEADAHEAGIEHVDHLIDGLFPHYVRFVRQAGPPMGHDDVELTIRGLSATKLTGARTVAKLGAEAIGAIARRRLTYKPSRKVPIPLSVSSDELREQLSLDPTEIRTLFWVLRSEQSAGGVSPPMDAWTVSARDDVKQFRSVRNLGGYLNADRRLIRSAIASQKADPFIQHIVNQTHAATEVARAGLAVTDRIDFAVHPQLIAASSAQSGPHPETGGLIAVNAVEARLREITGMSGKAQWEQLVAFIFDAEDRLLPASMDGERQDLSKLFRGVGVVVRNPIIHNRVKLDRDTAGEAVAICSLLMRVLDRIETELAATAS